MVICKCNFLSDEYCRIFILKIFKLIIGLFYSFVLSSLQRVSMQVSFVQYFFIVPSKFSRIPTRTKKYQSLFSHTVSHYHTSQLPAGSAAGSSAGIVFTHGRFLGFSPRRGDTLRRSREKFGMEVHSSMPNFTLIGSGVGFTAPKTEKNGILPI